MTLFWTFYPLKMYCKQLRSSLHFHKTVFKSRITFHLMQRKELFKHIVKTKSRTCFEKLNLSSPCGKRCACILRARLLDKQDKSYTHSLSSFALRLVLKCKLATFWDIHEVFVILKCTKYTSVIIKKQRNRMALLVFQ